MLHARVVHHGCKRGQDAHTKFLCSYVEGAGKNVGEGEERMKRGRGGDGGRGGEEGKRGREGMKEEEEQEGGGWRVRGTEQG